MQLYQGLPIITNKITQEEMRGVPHHLLGRIGLEEETWTVGKFVGEALGVVGRGHTPKVITMADLGRSMKFVVGASYQYLLAVLITTHSRFCSKTR